MLDMKNQIKESAESDNKEDFLSQSRYYINYNIINLIDTKHNIFFNITEYIEL